MKWLCYVVLAACAVFQGCGADGGPVGTGIAASAISGNVVDVQTDTGATSSAVTADALGPIQVSIDGLPDASTMADSSGNFELSGHFDGTITLRFTVPQFQVTQQLEIPSGSTVVLQDIELQPGGVTVQAVRQLGFFGTVDLVDCSDGTLLVHERRNQGSQFLVHLDDQTSFVDSVGMAQSCAAIRLGRTVSVEGSIAYSQDRTITALVVTIAPPPPPPPQPVHEARFAGAIAALDCTAGFLVVDDSAQRTNVQLTARTRLTGGSGALTCQGLHLGDPVRGQGQINLRMPGVLVATQLVVTGPPDPEQSLRLMGFVIAIDCTEGALRLRDDETIIDVALSSATVITRRDGQRLRCADIGLGDRVNGLGQVSSDASGTLDAVQITVAHRGPGNALRP